MDTQKAFCLELWSELNSKLPDNGKNGNLIQGNWSCWNNGQHIFGSNGMDCWPVIEYVVTELKPKTILEIGFNVGHSCLMWLAGSPDIVVTSVDISTSESTMAGVNFVKERFPDRFNFINCDSKELHHLLKDQSFDLIIIDGGHHTYECLSDLELTKVVSAKHILIDDVNVMDGVIKALAAFCPNNPTFTRLHTWHVGWGVGLFHYAS